MSSFWIYLLLGILQGIFEWLPISSEAILTLVGGILLKEINPVDMALFLHLGTLVAVIIFFREDVKDVTTLKNRQLAQFLVISTVFSLIVGFPLYTLIKNVTLGNLLLLITGFGLLLTGLYHSKKIQFKINNSKLAVIAGILQGVAVIPGVSRSASTIFGLSIGENDPARALKLSYLMSAPVVVALSIYLFLTQPLLIDAWPALVSSSIIGCITLHFLLKLSRKINFTYLALIFAILCFIGASIGFLV